MTDTTIKTNSRPTRDEWQEHVRQWQAMDISKAAYCKNHTLNYHRFLYWFHLFSKPSDDFMPAKLADSQAMNKSGLCMLELSSGHKLHIQSREALLLLLEHLA